MKTNEFLGALRPSINKPEWDHIDNCMKWLDYADTVQGYCIAQNGPSGLCDCCPVSDPCPKHITIKYEGVIYNPSTDRVVIPL